MSKDQIELERNTLLQISLAYLKHQCDYDVFKSVIQRVSSSSEMEGATDFRRSKISVALHEQADYEIWKDAIFTWCARKQFAVDERVVDWLNLPLLYLAGLASSRVANLIDLIQTMVPEPDRGQEQSSTHSHPE